MILEIRDRTGKVVWKAPDAGKRAMSAAGRLPRDRHPRRATPTRSRTRSGPRSSRSATARAARGGPRRSRRARRTTPGTSPPTASSRRRTTRTRPALAVGVWMGNSDHSMPRAHEPAISLTAAAPLWHAFVRELTNGEPVADFKQPERRRPRADRRVDRRHARARGPATRPRELFIAGTQPGGPQEPIDPPGPPLLRVVRRLGRRPGQGRARAASWDADVANWIARARRASGGRPVRLADRLLLGPLRLGRAALGGVLRAIAEVGPRQRQRTRAAAGPRAAGWAAPDSHPRARRPGRRPTRAARRAPSSPSRPPQTGRAAADTAALDF